MPRIKQIELEEATGKSKELLENVNKAYGMIPNVIKVMANSPAVIESYLNFQSALDSSSLSKALREQLALVVAESNDCNYCLSAHTAIGKSLGLSIEEIEQNRFGLASDDKTKAALSFAKNVVENKGRVKDEDLQALRNEGYNDGEISEIVATVIVNIFTNYLNHIAGTEIDFPLVEAKNKAA